MSVGLRLRALMQDVGMTGTARGRDPSERPALPDDPLREPELPPELEDLPPLDFEDLDGLRERSTWAGRVPCVEARVEPGEALGRTVPSRWAEASVKDLGTLLADPRLEGLRVSDALFLDIEATGLFGGAGCTAFLIGLGWFEEDGAFTTRQILQRSPDDELPALALLSDELERRPLLVSYNGKSYDLSVLQTRLVVQRLYSDREAGLKLTPHIDLLHVGRRLWAGLFEDYRLGTLEARVLDTPRHDDLPGSLVPSYYFAFVHGGNARYLEPVLEHNLVDVRSMAGLLAVVLERLDRPERYTFCEEVLNLGRWLYERGEVKRGLTLLERALHLPLSEEHRDQAFRAALKAYRQQGRAAALLSVLEAYSAELPHIPDPFVELAKHFEHRRREPARALEMARAALDRVPAADLVLKAEVEHRIARLERRVQRLAAGTPSKSGHTPRN